MPSRQQSWWKQKTALERRLLLLFVVALVLVVSLAIALVHVKSSSGDSIQDVKVAMLQSPNTIPVEDCKNSSKLRLYEEICMTPGCIHSASQILENLDTNVDPCDDFYQFTCGNYLRTKRIAEDKTQISCFAEINDKLNQQLRAAFEEDIVESEPNAFKNVKNYYKSCLAKDEIEKIGLGDIKEIVKNIGGWPILEGDDWNAGLFDWRQGVYKLKSLGFDPGYFIEYGVGADFKNSSRHVFQIDQATLGLNREFLVKGLNEPLVKAYYQYMVDVAVIFGADKHRAETELNDTLLFEIKLANYSASQQERRDIDTLYNPMSIEELNNKYPSIPWLEYINNLLPPDVQVNNAEVLVVLSPKYLKSFERLMSRTPKRVQANYMIWRAVKSVISYLTESLRERQLKFVKAISGVSESPPRWNECVKEIQNSLPVVTGALYVRKYFNEDGKKVALEMVKYIREKFDEMLKQLDWMDDETRKNALGKAATIEAHIAYPDELMDDKKIESIFGNVEVDAKRFLKSHLNINTFSNNFYMMRLRQPVNKTNWIDHGNPAQVNAYYNPLENSIIFPAGILQGQLFNKDRPLYLNYGAIGSVIGHEITHGFDDTGKRFDKDGNLVNWWAENTQNSFVERAQCIIYQYGNYTVPAIGQNLNGYLTQGENIADNGGVKEAYLAYNTWVKNNGEEKKLPGLDYTPNQLFWISAAMNWCTKYRPESLKVLVNTDTHSPGEFRVMGPFSNFEEFSKDFSCPAGTRMNPVNKCTVW